MYHHLNEEDLPTKVKSYKVTPHFVDVLTRDASKLFDMDSFDRGV